MLIDSEEDEDEERGKSMFSILFGNVDDSGDLDEEYLDQDAKEHLAALANELGESLVDIELSSQQKEIGVITDDFGHKADDAVDYEDIEEQYEGPEVQLQFEDENAIFQDQQFYAEVALSSLPSTSACAFGSEDEDYDEERNIDDKEDYDKDEDFTKGEKYAEADSSMQEPHGVSQGEGIGSVTSFPDPWFGNTVEDKLETPHQGIEHASELQETYTSVIQVSADANEYPPKLHLPVLYTEDGKDVLRFSELFGYHEPTWGCKKERKQQKITLPRVVYWMSDELLEEDEDVILRSCPLRKEVFEQQARQVFDEGVDSACDGGSEVHDLYDDNLQPSLRVMSKRHMFESAQPMKEDKESWEWIVGTTGPLPSPNLHPVHQEDWESSILWGNGQVQVDVEGTLSDKSGVSEESDSDTWEKMTHVNKENEECQRGSVEQHLAEMSSPTASIHLSRPVLVEPLGSISKSNCLPRDIFRHPQLLRLDKLPSLMEEDGKAKVCGSKGARSIIQKMSVRNVELLSGTWMEEILWDDETEMLSMKLGPKVILDLQDNRMVFELREGQDMLRKHAAAMIVSPISCRSNTLSEGGHGHNVGLSSLARFNISNDKYYMNKKNQQQQKASLKKRNVHGIKVMHSLPALKLQTMKPKLTNKDLSNFHRPKAVWYPHHNEVAAKEQERLSVEGPMKVIAKSMGGKGSRIYVDGSETVLSVKVKVAKKFGDLKATERAKIFYGGKELEDNISLAQQEVKPNSVLHLVRTIVHPWPKAQRLPGENKATRPPGAFKRKSDLSVKDGHVFIAEYCEERPLLLNNVGMGARLCTYYRKLGPTDSNVATLRNDRGSHVGNLLSLEPTEESPFLGDIRPGQMQTCFETNMYRAPVFQHRVPHTDFLLVRSAKGRLSLRKIDSIHVIGQQEPHIEVFIPGSKTVQSYLSNRLLAYMYREFRSNEKPGFVPRLRADEVAAQFPSLSEAYLRKRLKHCADLQKGSGAEMWWVMKPSFRIPSEEELRRIVTPENVCAYESMQAGLYHLKRMGVSKLMQPSGLSTAMNQLADEAIVLAAASHIERELHITPWNLSCNFVAATIQGRGSLERLEITGTGDPSGRGLGFSYLRAAPKPAGAGALVEKKAAAARGGGAVTGTDADLRRLSMDAAREVLLKFNVPESQIEKLTRWHRIALVRKLSSEQVASGVKLGVTALNKFARGQRMSLLQVQQQIRERCQAIWDRQVQSLCATDGDVSESEGEPNEDLDSFAGDLENLLEAEEGEADEVASSKAKKEMIRGTTARRHGLQAQREEDIEDEEAEAAELRRMLMEDDDMESGKKKKKVVSNLQIPGDAGRGPMEEGVQAPSKPNSLRKKKIIKRIIRSKRPDGTFTSREELISDPDEVEKYLASKKAAQNGVTLKEKKTSLAVKKLKKIISMKEGTKPRKILRGDAAKDGGVQLVCGACKQVGHMRTNKKVCPLYNEDAKANATKAENTETAEQAGLGPARPGIKIILKSGSGILEGDLPPEPIPAPIEQKPTFKIRLPLARIVDSTPVKVTEDNSGRQVQEKPHRGDESSGIVTKIKIKKSLKVEQEDTMKHAHGTRHVESLLVDTFEFPGVEKDALALPWEDDAQPQRLPEQDNIEAQRHMLHGRWDGKLEREDTDRERQERIEMKANRKKEKESKPKWGEARLRLEWKDLGRELIGNCPDLEEMRRIQEAESMESEYMEMNWRERRLQEIEMEQKQRDIFLKKRERLRKIREQEQREKEEMVELQDRRQSKRPVTRDWNPWEHDQSTTLRKRGAPEAGSYRGVPDAGHQSKRRKGGEVELANILEGIVDKMRNRTDISYLFLKPVKKKEAPDYLDIIRCPMDLSIIRERARKMVYKSHEEFRRDVLQIVENAHIYNKHRNPQIPPYADSLLMLCDEFLEERSCEIREAEMGIERLDVPGPGGSSRVANRRLSRH